MKKIVTCLFLLLTIVTACKKKDIITPPEPEKGSYFVNRMTYTAPLIGGDLQFHYNAANKIIEIVQKNVGRLQFEYDNNLLTKMTATGLFPGHTEYLYTNNLLTKEIRYRIEQDASGSTHTRKKTYEYDWQGNNKVTAIRAYNSANVLTTTAQVTYNDQGSPLKVSSSQGFENSYTYSAAAFSLFPGNENIYTCLEDIILTPLLNYTTPADLNYFLPFTKEIASYTEKDSEGHTRLVLFTYEKNERGLLQKLTIKHGSLSPIIYVFEYEKR